MNTDKYKDLKKKKEELEEERMKLDDRFREKQEKIKPLWKLLEKNKLAISKIEPKDRKNKKYEYIIKKCEHNISPIAQEMKKINCQIRKKEEEIIKIKLEIEKCLGLI